MNEALLKNIVEIITNRLNDTIVRVFLFGSRAGEKNLNPNADIDIGIIATKKIKFEDLRYINEELDKLQTLLKVDVVDFTERDDDFTDEALVNIEVLYEKR